MVDFGVEVFDIGFFGSDRLQLRVVVHGINDRIVDQMGVLDRKMGRIPFRSLRIVVVRQASF